MYEKAVFFVFIFFSFLWRMKLKHIVSVTFCIVVVYGLFLVSLKMLLNKINHATILCSVHLQHWLKNVFLFNATLK